MNDLLFWNMQKSVLHQKYETRRQYPEIMRGSRKDKISAYVITLQVIKNIETQRSYKMSVNLDNLKVLKTFIKRFQNYLFIW